MANDGAPQRAIPLGSGPGPTSPARPWLALGMCRLAWRLDQRLVSPREKRSSTICRRPCMADRTGREQPQSVGRTCRNWRPDIFALASANGFQQISVHHNWTSQRLLRRRNPINQLERLHHRASKISMGTQQASRQNPLGIGPSCLDSN